MVIDSVNIYIYIYILSSENLVMSIDEYTILSFTLYIHSDIKTRFQLF